MNDDGDYDRETLIMVDNPRKLNPSVIWLLFLFLGWSYGSMNEMEKQIFYYLTIGGFGIWALYRLFTLNAAIKKYNSQAAQEISLSPEDVDL